MKDKDGVIKGYTEHSISMGFETNRVRVERDFEFKYGADKRKISNREYAWSLLSKTVAEKNKEYANKGMTFKLFRASSKNCPIILDWREVEAMRKDKRKHDKYKWRNLPFKLKENVTF